MTAHTTIFFNGLRAMRLAGEEMISTNFPRPPFGSQVTRLPAAVHRGRPGVAVIRSNRRE
jgi:hypothetical protein